MDERTLQNTCLITILLGIFSLLLISQHLQPKNIDISQISKKNLNQEIKTQGTVTAIKDKNVLTLVELSSKDSKIDIVAYKEDLNDLKKGDNIQVIGTVSQYNNKLQIEARTITII